MSNKIDAGIFGLTAEIVAAYISKSKVVADALPRLIADCMAEGCTPA